MAVLLLAWPDKTRQLLKRACRRGQPAQHPGRRPGDCARQRDDHAGQKLDVSVVIRDAQGAIGRARVRGPDGTETALAIAAGTENGCPRLAFTCPPAEASFRYRISAGDALSGYYNVQVVPPPTAKDVQMRIRLSRLHLAAAANRARRRRHPGRRRLQGHPEHPHQQAAPPRALIVRSQIDQNSDATLSADGTEATITTELGRSSPGDRRSASTMPTDSRACCPGVPSAPSPTTRRPPASSRQTEPSLHLGRNDRLPLLYAVGDDYGISGMSTRAADRTRPPHADRSAAAPCGLQGPAGLGRQAPSGPFPVAAGRRRR